MNTRPSRGKYDNSKYFLRKVFKCTLHSVCLWAASGPGSQLLITSTAAIKAHMKLSSSNLDQNMIHMIVVQKYSIYDLKKKLTITVDTDTRSRAASTARLRTEHFTRCQAGTDQRSSHSLVCSTKICQKYHSSGLNG